MKVFGFDGLMGSIYRGNILTFWKWDELVMSIWYDDVAGKIVVERGDGSEELYSTFRNGNSEFKDLENYCEGYKSMLNDAYVEVEVH